MNANKSEANAPQRLGELALQGIYAELPEDLKEAFRNDALVNQSIMNSAEVGASYQRAIESLAIDLIRSRAAERDRLINAHGMTLLNATPDATDKPILEARLRAKVREVLKPFAAFVAADKFPKMNSTVAYRQSDGSIITTDDCRKAAQLLKELKP